MSNPLVRLGDLGQSPWYDFITRNLVASGELAQLIREDGLRGMTSNPTIFEKAVTGSGDYDDDVRRLAAEGAATAEIVESLMVDDVRAACDVFRPVYDAHHNGDGTVSLEVAPTLAHDTEATIAEAERLWQRVDRPNVMIKVPGTAEGVPAVRELIANGVNVNITLLFAVDAHQRVIGAYIEGLEARAAAGKPIANVASVASFFVSRVDTAIDARIDTLVRAGTIDAARGKALQGKAAIANAKLAYRLAMSSFSGPRWAALAARGARVQRPLWASTSTKNPAYRDVIYVEALIGPHTVNTLPPATLDAFRDHGETRQTIDTAVDEGAHLLTDLDALGISMNAVTGQLLTEGLASFQKSFDSLLAGLERKSEALGRALVGAH